jgi:alkylhydroperoxidase/carboxymuconolactone decarboxylase family protein YurZ
MSTPASDKRAIANQGATMEEIMEVLKLCVVQSESLQSRRADPG